MLRVDGLLACPRCCLSSRIADSSHTPTEVNQEFSLAQNQQTALAGPGFSVFKFVLKAVAMFVWSCTVPSQVPELTTGHLDHTGGCSDSLPSQAS